ncbi:barstar family protein [Streptomyces avermitilis]|uniref:barstar family protein n=1 Tax=Streptomyces avermitilis TaxID=33903 RepID=UPI0033A41540
MNNSSLQSGCYLTGDGEGGDFWGKSRDVTGLFASLGGGLRRVKLTGIAPQGRLLDCVGRTGTRRALAGNADIVLLDVNDAEIGSYFVADVLIEGAKASCGDAKLMDLIVTLDCENLLPDAETPWNLIRSGKLNRIEMWRSFDAAGRHAWLSVALNHHGYRGLVDAQPGAAYELDGRHITDESSFYCSLGESINGPGGYFGWNLSALNDCLRGGWGASTPFTLNWHHSAESIRRIAEDVAVQREYEGRYLEYLTEIFDSRAVEVNFM